MTTARRMAHVIQEAAERARLPISRYLAEQLALALVTNGVLLLEPEDEYEDDEKASSPTGERIAPMSRCGRPSPPEQKRATVFCVRESGHEGPCHLLGGDGRVLREWPTPTLRKGR